MQVTETCFEDGVGSRATFVPSLRAQAQPKKFTQPQLFACLTLKEFLQLDYRKLAETLANSPSWIELLGLKEVPHFTTFQKAAGRLLQSTPSKRLLDATVKKARETRLFQKRISLASMDGSGWKSHHASIYYLRRCAKTEKSRYRSFPKAGLLCDTQTHFILGIVPGRGPGSDIVHFRSLLAQGVARIPIDTVAA